MDSCLLDNQASIIVAVTATIPAFSVIVLQNKMWAKSHHLFVSVNCISYLMRTSSSVFNFCI